MKILIPIFLSIFFLSACNNNSNETVNEDSIVKDTITDVEESPIKHFVEIETQLKNGLLFEFYKKEIISIKENKLYFSFKFDLNSDGGNVPDTYGMYLNFNFEAGEKLVFPKQIAFEEESFNEEVSARLERYEGIFELVAAKDDLLIYNSLKPQRTLVLFKDNKQTGDLAYYFSGLDDLQINEENVYEVIHSAYEEGEMVLEHSRSSTLSSVE